MNPLPSTWKYPRGITLIHLINLWLIGDKEQNVPPLGKVSTQWVRHFDNNARNYSKMKQVMGFVETFGRRRGVWLQSNTRWDGKAVTILWSAVWEDLSPYMSTKTFTSSSSNVSLGGEPTNSSISYHKSQNGQVAVRSIYNKIFSDRKLAGNKPRKKQRINQSLFYCCISNSISPSFQYPRLKIDTRVYCYIGRWRPKYEGLITNGGDTTSLLVVDCCLCQLRPHGTFKSCYLIEHSILSLEN